ncbi:MAG TPA: heavy metal translocating P-type ATPase metal-binding domain-containing protein, partial [Turneriella sp.]|nr:heavy metal translocating P-type ATPase metal-binding domain-containing protein [Turneriella sp.]
MAAESFIATTKTVNICAHCGASSAFLKHANSFFCCDGCRRVYTILKEQNLLGYYEMGENTPLSLKGEAVHDFSYADSVWFHKTFTTPLSHGRYQMRLKLPAIHCAATTLSRPLPSRPKPASTTAMNRSRKELTVVAQDSLSVSKLVQFVTDLGYTPDFKPESSRSRSLTQYDKGLLKRMAVAAFGFGNAMFFSLPDYLTHNLETRFQTLFITLNLSLALLVLFYSAGEFFTNAWRALKKKKIILDLPIALGIVAMFTRSVLEISVGVSSGYFDTFAGLIFFLLIGRYVQSRSYTYLAFERDNLLFLPLAVRVVHEGAGEKTTPVQDLRTQDTIRLLNGEIAPTRCRVLSDSVAVDYSFTTGESQPVILPKGDILEIGGKVVGHSALFSVMEPVDQARVNRVWESATSDTAEISFTEESSFADKVLPYFTLIVLGIATAGFLYWLPQDTTMAWNVFTAVVVITCPCALAMAKPFSFYTTLSALGRSGLFLKSAAVVEKFFNIGTIILDKTGTITSAHEYDVTFHGVDNQILSEEAAVKIYSLTRESTHPLSKAITAHLAQNKDFIFADALAFEEVLGEGLSARVDGTLCVLGSRRYLESKNSTVTKSDADT